MTRQAPGSPEAYQRKLGEARRPDGLERGSHGLVKRRQSSKHALAHIETEAASSLPKDKPALERVNI